jgi:hypothetical protein
MPTIIHLRNYRRESGIDLLEAIDAELRSVTRTIVACEHRAANVDDISERLYGHLSRLENIQRLALSLHERDVSVPS